MDLNSKTVTYIQVKYLNKKKMGISARIIQIDLLFNKVNTAFAMNKISNLTWPLNNDSVENSIWYVFQTKA